MWVDNRVIFEIENRERGIERHREAAVTLILEFNDVFFCLLLDVDEPMKCSFVDYIYEEMGKLVLYER